MWGWDVHTHSTNVHQIPFVAGPVLGIGGAARHEAHEAQASWSPRPMVLVPSHWLPESLGLSYLQGALGKSVWNGCRERDNR